MNQKSEIAESQHIVNAPSSDEGQPQVASSHSHHVSTQMKLLDLAKKFQLDGGLVQHSSKLPLSERADKRELHALLLKQHNIEKIMSKAMNYSSKDEITDLIDQDWFTHFIQLAENISNKTMQDLWAKILVTEISSAGSFSLKTLEAFRLMSVSEAKIFAKACSLATTDRTKSHYRIISAGYSQPGLFTLFSKTRDQKVNLSGIGFDYSDILTLADNHLLFLQETESNQLNKAEEISFFYDGKPITLSPKKNNSILSFYKFTQMGTELARLMSSKSSEEYLRELHNTVGQLFNINTN